MACTHTSRSIASIRTTGRRAKRRRNPHYRRRTYRVQRALRAQPRARSEATPLPLVDTHAGARHPHTGQRRCPLVVNLCTPTLAPQRRRGEPAKSLTSLPTLIRLLAPYDSEQTGSSHGSGGDNGDSRVQTKGGRRTAHTARPCPPSPASPTPLIQPRFRAGPRLQRASARVRARTDPRTYVPPRFHARPRNPQAAADSRFLSAGPPALRPSARLRRRERDRARSCLYRRERTAAARSPCSPNARTQRDGHGPGLAIMRILPVLTVRAISGPGNCVGRTRLRPSPCPVPRARP